MHFVSFYDYLAKRKIIELRSSADGIMPGDGTSLSQYIERYCNRSGLKFDEVLKDFVSNTRNEIVYVTLPYSLIRRIDPPYCYRVWYVAQ